MTPSDEIDLGTFRHRIPALGRTRLVRTKRDHMATVTRENLPALNWRGRDFVHCPEKPRHQAETHMQQFSIG
jgi:hypothetical protein